MNKSESKYFNTAVKMDLALISLLKKKPLDYILNDFLSYFSLDIQSIALHLADCQLDELFFICDKYLKPYLNYIKDHKEVFATALKH